ncbi:MAG: potassium channel protein [Desulfobacterales bacterium]|nr:potassium channel protein [Desulfobacterales bacterium]
MSGIKKAIGGILVAIAILLVGTIGYMLLEGWNCFDALYMTVITLTTVGYGETHELSGTGKAFTLILILVGAGVLFYIISMIAEFVVEGQIREVLGRHKLEKQIKKLKDHYIICGYGRVGQTVCEIFSSKSLKMVVIDKNSDRIAQLQKNGLLYVEGEATNEESLIEAGIERAMTLVSALGSDVDNLYVTLSARGLNPGLFIIARSGSIGSGKKLLRAGADKVVSPYRIGARRMARMILHPTTTDFLELLRNEKMTNFQLEEIPVGSSSDLIGVSLENLGMRQNFKLNIVAIKKADGNILFNPSSKDIVEAGDTLIVIGADDNIAKLERLLNPFTKANRMV